jgi:hypothetical protein
VKSQRKAITGKPYVPTEDVEQTKLIRWADHHWFGKHLFAIPNGGLRNKIVAAKLKAQGVRAGVSDLMLAIPSKDSHGLFIEMKRTQGSSTSESQKNFIKDRIYYGYEAHIAKGSKEAEAIILEYIERCERVRSD